MDVGQARDQERPPGEQACLLQLGENLIHQWDIAAALGRPTTLDPAAVPVVDEFLRQFMAPLVTPEMRAAGGPIGPEVAVPPDAPLADRLLAFHGRDVARWGSAG